MEQHESGTEHRLQSGLWSLSVGALGVVYGDIGTSPLYAVKECFHGLHAIETSQANVFGILSLIFWSLTMVVSFKYILFIIKVDNKGEGGIFALLALIPQAQQVLYPKLKLVLVASATFGASLLYGDGIITPAISVLSAIEGLNVATEAARPLVLPITCSVLFLFFWVQKWGTKDIGRIFGLVMIVWFVTIAGLGLWNILSHPTVLAAINPVHAIIFFGQHGMRGLVVLASVVLCITGGEALYADLGHFGHKAIERSWAFLVFPALLLNYFGQGALLLFDPAYAMNPFYGLVPRILLYPMVALATLATIIASQAMISGVFSLTQQAIQLGYCPRMQIVHTSHTARGQIYMPEVNRALMIACLGLVLIFRESSRLAGAYGIAVTAAMAITSFLYFFAKLWNWRWPLWKVVSLVGLFLVFDLTYFGANLIKILDGGWFTLAVAIFLTILMNTWKEGRDYLSRRYYRAGLSISAFIADVARTSPYRVPGTAVFMTISSVGTPSALLHHFKHNHVLHERILLLSMLTKDVPAVEPGQRVEVQELGQGFFRVMAWYGFMETPQVPEIMGLLRDKGFHFEPFRTSYFLGRETLLSTDTSSMSRWRKWLFVVMSRNVPSPTACFKLPPNRVIELGSQIKL
ncbi:putative potassium transport system protein kup 2 [Desulfovibrionales bacterium]